MPRFRFNNPHAHLPWGNKVMAAIKSIGSILFATPIGWAIMVVGVIALAAMQR